MRAVLCFMFAILSIAGCASKPTASESKAFYVIGHRGAAAYAPENTIPSFEYAKSLGLRDVELDIQETKDGEIILFHDSKLETKTSLKGAVHEHTLSDLQKTEIGTWFDRERGLPSRMYKGTTLVTLRDLFKKFGRDFYYHVEIKAHDETIPQKTLEIIRAAKLEDQSRITSFYFEQLERVRKIAPRYPLTYLIDDKETPDVRAEILRAKKAGFEQVAVRAPVLEASHVDYAHSLELSLRAWGIKSDEDMNRALQAGAEGMTTDWPDRLINVMLQKMRL